MTKIPWFSQASVLQLHAHYIYLLGPQPKVLSRDFALMTLSSESRVNPCLLGKEEFRTCHNGVLCPIGASMGIFWGRHDKP